MKTVWRIVVSFLAAVVLLMVGGFIRHPGWCADCSEPHGFPSTYQQDGGFACGAAFYPIWLAADLLIFALLSAGITWAWNRILK
jgi:hypothetical protein